MLLGTMVYIKADLWNAYHLIRITIGAEWTTAVNTTV